MMRNLAVLICGLFLSTLCPTVLAEFPTPSPYPISWELDFQHQTPQRIVVTPPGSEVPVAYWYMTYTITNNTDSEQVFLPIFEMLTNDGQVIRSDNNIPAPVFDAIRERERNEFLEPFVKIGGDLRIGEDEAREGVAIWREPMPEMGRFSIFVGGLNGEAATVAGPDGKDVILRKTLQLNYFIRGDEIYPGEDEINDEPQKWVMR